MKGSLLLWTLLLVSLGCTTVLTSKSPPACDSRCVCYDDISSNLKTANCSNVHYRAKSFLLLLKHVKILGIHDGNENGGIFSETLSSCNNLEELYVNENRQSSINPRTLQNCKKLRVLDVSNNKISKVSQINVLLKQLPNLERLMLQGNPIAALPDLTSSSVTHLDLSYCHLNIVGEKTFVKLRKLHTLNLEGNNLKKFKSVLPGSLRVLNLILNDIATISPVEHFSKLKVLEVAGNPLQCTCDLVHLRNEETAELVSSHKEATCAGPKPMRGLSWSKARKQCELGQLSRRQRRDLEEEGSGYDGETYSNEETETDSNEETDIYDGKSSWEIEQIGNRVYDDDDEDEDTSSYTGPLPAGKKIGEEDSTKRSDPITAPAEEKTEEADPEKVSDPITAPAEEKTEEVDPENVFDPIATPDEDKTEDKDPDPITAPAEEKTEEADPENVFDPIATPDEDKSEDKDPDPIVTPAEEKIEEEDSDKDSDPEAAPAEEKTEEEDSVKDSDPETAAAEEKTESPDSEETKLVDSKLSGTVDEPHENSQGEVGRNFFETDHSTSSTTEHEFIQHKNENDDTSVVKEDETISGSVSENDDTHIDAWSTENEETEDSDDFEENNDYGAENTDQAGPDETENSETEEEMETDEQSTDDKEDITGSENENVFTEIKQEEDSENKENEEVNIYNLPDYDHEGYDEYKTDDEKPEDSPTENTPVNESWSEGSQHDTDETSTSKWSGSESDIDEASGELEEDEEIPPINPPSGDNDSIPIMEDVFNTKIAVDVGSDKKTISDSETDLEDSGSEGSGADSEDAEPSVTPSTKNVTVGHAGHGRRLFLGEPDVKEGGDGEVGQATTQPVSREEAEATVGPVAPASEDTSESPLESPVTSTGSYVVLGLIMVLIVFLLGYAVYKSRLGRRRSDSDSRTIKEKDVELGKGNDRELQDVSKPLLLTTPAAAVNGKSELQQPLVSKPTENPQLKDDVEDKKKNSPLQSRYHIYETLNGDKERIEVPPPTNTTIPVSTSPKKSPSPTRAVSTLPPPRDGDSPGPNMYGDDDDGDGDGEVFLKNNHNGDLGSPRSLRVTVVEGDLSVPKKPVFVVNPGAAASNGVV